MEFLTRFKNALFLIAILVAQAIALAVQYRTPPEPGKPEGQGVRLIRLWVASIVTPVERATHAVGSGTRNAWLSYIDLRHARQENKDLKQQLAQMRLQQAAVVEDALQARRLQAMLGFREHYVASTVAAQVIGASGSDQSHVLTIDKGSKDGLKPDMAVITQDGIVGKVRDVFPSSAQVLEINDPSSGAGVILETTRIRAILRGTIAGRVEIDNLTADSRIKPGEKVLTSGGDQVYPKGLPVGTIVSIAPDPDHQPYTAIAIKPAVDLDRAEEVLVITGFQQDVPEGAQQDIAAAEAQHAADISAERLPRIHDDQPQADANGAPAATGSANNPTLKAPHPLPTIHPDKYSTGSTPPATELKPGARLQDPAVQTPASDTAPQTNPARKPAPPSNEEPQ
jgi:rod shape-determining protein MreC